MRMSKLTLSMDFGLGEQTVDLKESRQCRPRSGRDSQILKKNGLFKLTRAEGLRVKGDFH